MSMFRFLNLRYLRRQPLRATLAVIAIAAAVAGAVAGVVLINSLDRSLEAGLRGMAGPVPIRVIGPLTRGGLAPDVIDRIAATEGVETAVPAVTAIAVAQRVGGDPTYVVALGFDCRVEAVVGAFGCDAQSLDARKDGPVLISSALVRSVGKDADIRTDVGRVPIEGAVVNDSLDDFNGGRVAVFELSTAQRLFDRGRNIDAIFVRPEKGADVDGVISALREVVGDQNFVLRSDEPAPWMQSRGPLIPLLGIGLLLSLGLSGLLVYNILSLSLADRRRDLAVASAVGTSPAALTGGIVAESALLGLVGGILGVVAGLFVARPLVGTFASVISESATGLRVTVFVPIAAYVVGLVVGIGVGAVSALVPARRAVRLDLAAELHGRAALEEERTRRVLSRVVFLIVGSALTMALSWVSISGGAIEPWQPPLGALSIFAATFLMFAAVGTVSPMVIGAIARYARNGRGPIRVAIANLVSRPRRTRVIATAVGSAVGLACVLGALIPATRATVVNTEVVGDRAGVTLRTLPLNNASNVDARPSKALLSKVRRIEGVDSVGGSYQHEVSDDIDVYSVWAFEEVTEWGFKRVRGEVGAAPLERGEAIIGTSLARTRGLRPGSTLSIPTPTGVEQVTVSGIWVSSFNNGFNAIVSPQVFKRLFGDQTPHGIDLLATPGTTADELAERVRAANLDPDLIVRTGAESAIALSDEIADQASPFWMLQRVLLLVALVGTLSTLLLVGVQRRRELGVLGAVGFTPSALGRMTLSEALAACLAGCLLGAIASLALFEVLRNASAVSVGVRSEYRVEPLSALLATVLALVVVAVGAALPAWRAGRVQIVEAIRDE
jgi:putative ABC transport system permease protein